jgi:hypothetical protein
MADLVCLIDLDADAGGKSLCGRQVGEIQRHYDAATKTMTMKVAPIVPVVEGLDAWWVNRSILSGQVCHDCLAAVMVAADVTAPAKTDDTTPPS